MKAFESTQARIRVMQRLLELHAFVRIEANGDVVGSAPENDSDSCQYIDVSLGSIASDRDVMTLDSYLVAHPKPHTW